MSAPDSHAVRISVGEKQPGNAATPLRWQTSMIAGFRTGLTTKLAPASMTRVAVCGVEYRASAEQEIARQRGRESVNQINRPWHGHGDLDRADATLGQCIDDSTQAIRILHADDRNDAGGLDRCGHRLSLADHRASHPPSTARMYPWT